MKTFFVQAFWIIAITILLNIVAGVIFSVALPNANHQALGQMMFLPSFILAILITVVGTRMGKLPGTKKS